VSSRELSGRKRIRKKNPERICYFLSWDSLFLLLFTGKQRSWIRRSYVDPLTTFPVTGFDVWYKSCNPFPFLFLRKERKGRDSFSHERKGKRKKKEKRAFGAVFPLLFSLRGTHLTGKESSPFHG
jgi:hypothetical protein